MSSNGLSPPPRSSGRMRTTSSSLPASALPYPSALISTFGIAPTLENGRMDEVMRRLDELYAIGATRIGYSREEDEAHELVARWLEEAGLDVARDAAGNTFGRRGDARLWLGSHVDSVPNRGRFDRAPRAVAPIAGPQPTGVPPARGALPDEGRRS